MNHWLHVGSHAVRPATAALAVLVAGLVVGVFLIGGHHHAWWAGLIALVGWLLLFVPRFRREDRRWRMERR